MATAPHTMNGLAGMEIAVRSDYATWCAGWDNICEQLSVIASGVEDELYLRLAANAGSDYTARSKARRATRPLRHLATSARVLGRLGPRCFRIYARHYAEEINPQRGKQKFDHQK